MKALIGLLCLVAVASAHKGHLMKERPTGRPDWHQDWRKKLDDMSKLMEQKKKEWNAQRPTGRPNFDSWMKKLAEMRKVAEEKRKEMEEKWKQWNAVKPTGRPEWPDKWHRWGPFRQHDHDESDETHVISRFGQRKQWHSRPTGRPQTRKERLEQWKKDRAEKVKQWEEKKKQKEANRPTGRPQTRKERLEQWKKDRAEKVKQWAEKKKQMEANRPTGRPQTWRARLERMKKAHEEMRKKWISRPTGRPNFQKWSWWNKKSDKDADETEIISPQTGISSFQSKFEEMMSQHKGSYSELQSKLYKLFRQSQDALNIAHQKAQKKAYDAEKQRQLAALQKAAAPWMNHIDDFKAALDKFLDQNPDATESQMWSMVYKMYMDAYRKLSGARPTGRPSLLDINGHRFAQSALRKANDEARKTVGKIVEQMRIDADRKEAGAFLTHVDDFQTAFEDFLAENPKGTSSELRKMLDDLYKKHHDALDNARPTGRPSYEENKAFWKAHQLIHKNKYDARQKMAAWQKQMAQLMKDSGAQN